MPLVEPANSIWADGPMGAPSQPPKDEIRRWGTWLESLISAGSLGDIWKATYASLAVSLAHAADTVAVVYNDPSSPLNGSYVKVGGSGTGSWLQKSTFLPGYQFVTANTSGSANAIVATTSPRLPWSDGVALVHLTVPATNTSTTVTVAFDGQPPVRVKTFAGNDPAIGTLVGGSSVLGTLRSGATQFWVASDPPSSAQVAAVEADRAEVATTKTEIQNMLGSLTAASLILPKIMIAPTSANNTPQENYSALVGTALAAIAAYGREARVAFYPCETYQNLRVSDVYAGMPTAVREFIGLESGTLDYGTRPEADLSTGLVTCFGDISTSYPLVADVAEGANVISITTANYVAAGYAVGRQIAINRNTRPTKFQPNGVGQVHSIVSTSVSGSNTLITISGTTSRAYPVSDGARVIAYWPIAEDADKDDQVVGIPTATYVALGFAIGKWFMIQRDTGETASAPLGMGEPLKIMDTYVVGANTWMVTDKVLSWSYPTSDKARVIVYNPLNPIAYTNVHLIGNFANPAGDAGNNGLAINRSERAEWNNCSTVGVERNGLRSIDNVEAFADGCRVEFGEAVDGGNIQYGFAIGGAHREAKSSNFRQDRGRHGIAQLGGSGHTQLIIDDMPRITGTYRAAIAEHECLLRRLTIRPVIRGCGDGFDYRGGLNGGWRRLVAPDVDGLHNIPDIGGGNEAMVVLRNNAGNVTVKDFKLRDARQIMRGDHLADPSLDFLSTIFDYRETAPGNVLFEGGEASQIQRGFWGAHQGGSITDTGSYSDANPAPGNQTQAGKFVVRGTKIHMSSQPSMPGVVTYPVYFVGKFDHVEIDNVDITYPDGEAPHWGAYVRTNGFVKISGGNRKNCLQDYIGSTTTYDATGAAVAGVFPYKAVVDVWPVLDDPAGTTRLIDGIGGGAIQRPGWDAILVNPEPASIAGTGDWVNAIEIPLEALGLGENGKFKLLGGVAFPASANTKEVRVRFGRSGVYTTYMTASISDANRRYESFDVLIGTVGGVSVQKGRPSDILRPGSSNSARVTSAYDSSLGCSVLVDVKSVIGESMQICELDPSILRS